MDRLSLMVRGKTSSHPEYTQPPGDNADSRAADGRYAAATPLSATAEGRRRFLVPLVTLLARQAALEAVRHDYGPDADTSGGATR